MGMLETRMAGQAALSMRHLQEEVSSFPVMLNSRWRVADDPIQWILQYRDREIRHSDELTNRRAWQGKHFCRTSAALKRCIREHCGDVDPVALAMIYTLEAWHV